MEGTGIKTRNPSVLTKKNALSFLIGPPKEAAHWLALEKGSTGASYHAVAEEGVAVREIAEAIGRGLKVPVVSLSREEAAQHFGFLGFFVGLDCPASSALTQQRLGWRPTVETGMIEDLDHASAFEA